MVYARRRHGKWLYQRIFGYELQAYLDGEASGRVIKKRDIQPGEIVIYDRGDQIDIRRKSLKDGRIRRLAVFQSRDAEVIGFFIEKFF